jgi:HAD superfamily hydrolase (TIGR01459 family)
MLRLDGLAELAGQYDGFIVDLWGVVHDGIAPYPGARECLSHLVSKPVVLLSNAPRRVGAAKEALRALGVEDRLYSALMTSGEATWLALRDRSDPWFAALGREIYHLGPARDQGLMEGLGLTRVELPAEAAFVLNTGPDDHRDGQLLEAFVPELEACLRLGLPMICANPDLEIVRGGARILCAGALARYYEAHGGNVRWVGKPDPAIYEHTLGLMGLDRRRVLAIGDSLRTDIAGAGAAGIDAVWVLGGIHAAGHGGDWARVENDVMQAGLTPLAVVPGLLW